MKSLVLAAGYATRLYPLTINTPKPLLKVANKPVINYIIEKLEDIKEIDQVYIVTNGKFYKNFSEWKKNQNFKKPIKILNDKTTSNEDKLGAIGDINFVIKREKIDDDLIVIAGDNLFEFNIKNLISYYKEKNSSIIVTHNIDNIGLMKLYSEVALDQNGKVIYFKEKPQNPKTTLAAICMYIFPKNRLELINAYLKEKDNHDAPGFFIEWFHKKDDIYAFKFLEKFYDIGNKEQLEEANSYFSSLL